MTLSDTKAANRSAIQGLSPRTEATSGCVRSLQGTDRCGGGGHCDAPQHPEGGKVRISASMGFPEKASTFEEGEPHDDDEQASIVHASGSEVVTFAPFEA